MDKGGGSWSRVGSHSALATLLCVIACGSQKSTMMDESGTGGVPGGNTMLAGSGGAPAAGSGGSIATMGSGGTSSGSGGSSMIGTGGSGDEDAGGAMSGDGGSAGMHDGGSPSGDGCTRDKLKAAVDAFYAALTAHSTDKLQLASNVKYTENAKMLVPGEGVWKTAGMLKFKRTAVDTMTCMTATESVISDGMTDRVYGVRLKLDDDGKISEIEALLVLDYILIQPSGLVNSKDDDWETVLPPDKQMPRDQLQAIMNKYLVEFPSGACGFASSCTRLEDGGSVGTCVDGSLVTCNMNGGGGGTPVLKPRLFVIDVDAGISVGFTVFLGGYDDFHLFKVRDGEVQSVHAVLTQTNNMTGWD